ncbi:hypothetical protein A2960_06080 [Candidatus Gottesmanbacteria bacterium RIFCSPLOWO2_01_FULL_39_12b]|uniref:RNase H type-1 domain-containing protein n=1 Tax=Candidatus Gottesmanbacteria bacterium RIFCSPLOWO2_01_FULL_39_12b TaxID=1798388 RepID=A0A1F6AP25_9BACT|nr:MAG: hypothetical protein A2960_06080 [Candidatus Gottesmanbacteria bacterium RIFCSPLOWO2_01_FULL_39_12b]
MHKLIIFTDGGARNNPGPAGIGVVIKTEEGKILNKISRKIGQTTNNVAEYTAVIEALEWLKKSSQLSSASWRISCHFYSDSTLVVNQLNGKFKVKDSKLRELLLKVRILEQEIKVNIYYNVIPRSQNSQADLLVNQALDS